jgi:hypothetical protein
MTLSEKIYTFISNAPGGAICRECEDALGIRHPTASARISELKRAGRVKDSGTKRDHSTVWVKGDGVPLPRDWRQVTLGEIAKTPGGFRLTKHGGSWLLRVAGEVYHCTTFSDAMACLVDVAGA